MGMLTEHTFFSDLRLPHTNHKHLHLNIFKFKEEAPTHCTFTNFKTLVCIFKYYDCFMETYLIYYEYFLKIIVYVYMWYLGHMIGKQQILICSKVVVKSNCTVYSVQWLNTWVTHTHNTHTQADTLTHWDSLFDTPQTSLYLNIWFKIQPLEKANIIDLQYLKKIFGRLYTALCICPLWHSRAGLATPGNSPRHGVDMIDSWLIAN